MVETAKLERVFPQIRVLESGTLLDGVDIRLGDHLEKGKLSSVLLEE